MADLSLPAQPRTIRGKQVRRLRRHGVIPANLYGRGIESLPVQLDARTLRDVLARAGTTTVVDVRVGDVGGGDGPTHPVLIEHVARHPATGAVLHVDLHRVDLDRPVRAAVPVTLVGEAPAVEHGGVLVHPLDTIEVEALPRDLPHAVEVDISALAEVDAQITVGDLRLPAGVTVDTDPETLVVRVVASRLEREVAAEEAAAQAEAAPEAESPGAPAAEGTAN